MKPKITLSLLLLSIMSFSQTINLRKAILKSDIIIRPDNYKSETIFLNDFTSKTQIEILKPNTEYATVYKNTFSNIPQKLIAQRFEDGEDFYSDLITNSGACVQGPISINTNQNYYDLFFIEKVKNEYHIIMMLNHLTSEKLDEYAHQIKTISNIEKNKNEKERFTKTLDWFIENGLLPDYDFVDYYKTKRITTDTIQYSEKQYQNALTQFKNGKEELLPIVKEKYFSDVKTYFIEKMELIANKSEPNYSDYYEFSRTFYSLFENKLEYGSGDYILYNALTSDKFDKYEKNDIMKHLIQLAKDLE